MRSGSGGGRRIRPACRTPSGAVHGSSGARPRRALDLRPVGANPVGCRRAAAAREAGAVKEFLDFLAGQSPYDQLDAAELERLARKVEVEYFVRGATIVTEGSAPL